MKSQQVILNEYQAKNRRLLQILHSHNWPERNTLDKVVRTDSCTKIDDPTNTTIKLRIKTFTPGMIRTKP